MHYTGTLTDGTKFDSSVDRGDPFSFTLGANQVIKGWDAAVGTMKLGEKVQLTLREDYAYGENGSPPTIPGGATLVRFLTLLAVESLHSLCVCEMHKAGVAVEALQHYGVSWELSIQHATHDHKNIKVTSPPAIVMATLSRL